MPTSADNAGSLRHCGGVGTGERVQPDTCGHRVEHGINHRGLQTSGQSAGRRVRIRRCISGCMCRPPLPAGGDSGQDSAQDAGEHVPASGGRHPTWSAVHADQRMVRDRNERGGTLEQDSGAGEAGELPDGAGRVGLDTIAIPPPRCLRGRLRSRQCGQEGGGLTGVRGQDVKRRAAQAPGEELSQDAQRSGVDDGRQPDRRCADSAPGCPLTHPGIVGIVGIMAAPAAARGSEGGTQDVPQLLGPGGVVRVDPRP